MLANREAFRRRRIVPRMLARDVAERDLSTTLLGTEMPAPLMLAPIGVQKVVHEEGELATARAAAAVGVPMIASTASHFTLEQIAEAGGPDAPRWFQLYWPNERGAARELRRPRRGGRLRGDRRHRRRLHPRLEATRPAAGPAPLPRRDGQRQLLPGPGLPRRPREDARRRTSAPRPAATSACSPNPSLSWDDLALLRELTSLPILVKGIQHVEDAREAAGRGVDGIVVSNHGGRQVGGAIGSLDALPAIAEAVGGELAVLFDSGVRGGADVLKALALGADAVCLGRPYLWGLALDGQAGVEAVLRMVLAELDLTMALCGYTEPDQLGPEALQPDRVGTMRIFSRAAPPSALFTRAAASRSRTPGTPAPPAPSPRSASRRWRPPAPASPSRAACPTRPRRAGVDAVLDHVAEIVEATDLPVNADFQAGYADDAEGVAVNVGRCVEAGVAGLSIEDATGRPEQPLFELHEAVERIRAAREAIDSSGADVLLTARAECFLVGHPEPLEESIRRLAAYSEAGADVLYAPGPRAEQIARDRRGGGPKPVNVLIGADLGLSLADLAELGVRRVSVGSALSNVTWGAFLRAAEELAEQGTFGGLNGAAPFPELNALFKRD